MSLVTSNDAPRVVTNTTLQAFFKESIDGALRNQRVRAQPTTAVYLVELLSEFLHADKLFDRGPDGPELRPLALLFADATEGQNIEERQASLRRMGDLALFISGIFPDSLNRKIIDMDYYVSMGGGAYGHLSTISRGRLRDVFSELAEKFVAFVDVLNEVREQSALNNSSDVLRQYEIWMRTGSQRAARILRQAGIHPSEAVVSRRKH